MADLRIEPAARRAFRDEDELDLTRKEFEVLYRLALESGRVVTREALMPDQSTSPLHARVQVWR